MSARQFRHQTLIRSEYIYNHVQLGYSMLLLLLCLSMTRQDEAHHAVSRASKLIT